MAGLSRQSTMEQIGEDIEDAEDPALRRRDKKMVTEMQEANRIFNPEQEQQWGLRYRNFSGEHMRNAYRVFAEARHDPFNKDPSWYVSVMRQIAKKLKQRGISDPVTLFRMADLNRDGVLERGEVRKMLMKVIPDLGDMEMMAVFEVLDANHDNEISGDEVAVALFGKRASLRPDVPCSSPRVESKSPRVESRLPLGGSTLDQGSGIASGGDRSEISSGSVRDMAMKYRTPVHRVVRMPPARLEGWDHLHHTPRFNNESEVMKAKQNDMLKRIGEQISSPRVDPARTYRYFGGGCDVKRFHVQRWRREKEGCSEIVSSIPDPGGCDIKPGFHVALRAARPELATFSTCTKPVGATRG